MLRRRVRLGRVIGTALLYLALAVSSFGVAAGQTNVPGLHVEDLIEYYDLVDATLAGVVRSLNATRLEGPEGPPSQGLTKYHIQPEWSAQAGGGRCRVVAVDIHVRVIRTLPRWPRVQERPAGEREDWLEIESAIAKHEERHRELVLEASTNLLERIRGLDAQGCQTLRDVVSSTVSIVSERLREAHADFDRNAPRRLRVG